MEISIRSGGAFTRMRLFRELRRKRWRGLTMLEFILYLGLAGVVVAGVVVYYTQASERQKRTDAITLLNNVRGGIERVFAGASSYTGVTIELLDNRGVIPDTARVSATVANHPFGDTLNVFVDGTNTRTFWIAFNDLDDEACADIAGSYIGKTRARSGIINALVVADTSSNTALAVPTSAVAGSATNRITASATAAVPYTAANVAGACDSGASANDLYIQFG